MHPKRAVPLCDRRGHRPLAHTSQVVLIVYLRIHVLEDTVIRRFMAAQDSQTTGGLRLSGGDRHLAEPNGLSTIGGVCPAITGQMWRLRRGNCVE